MVINPPRRPKGPAKPHSVEQAEGFFRVTSGSSGTIYRIVLDGETLICPCEGFRNRQKCSHIDAVLSTLKERGDPSA